MIKAKYSIVLPVFYFFSLLIINQLNSQSLSLTKTVDSTQIQTGQEFVYTLQYRCVGSTTNCENVFIRDTLPADLEYVSHLTSPVHTSDDNYDGSCHCITVELNNETGTGMMAGSTGEISIRVRFPNGSTPDNLIAENYGVISADNAGTINSNTVSTTADASPNYTIEKTGDLNIFLDADFTYSIEMDDAANGAFGSLDLDTFTLVDALPVGAVFVSATNGGTYNAMNHEVIWGFGATAHNTTETVMVTVNYPSSTFSAGAMVTNNVDFHGQPVGEPYGLLDTDNLTHTLLAPNPDATITKDLIPPHSSIFGNDSFIIGDTLNWEISVENTGSTPLDTFTIFDTISPQMELYQIQTGTYNNTPISLNIYYQTNLNSTYSLWPGSPFDGTSDQTLDVATDLTLGGGEYVNLIKYEFGTVPFGFANNNDIDIYAIVLDPDQDGNPVATNDVITNNSNLYYEFNNTPTTTTDSDSGMVRDTLPPATSVDKRDDEGTVHMGGFLDYFIVVANSGDHALDSLVVIDTIPAQMELDNTESGGWVNLTQDVEVYYQTNLNSTYQTWAGSPFGPTTDTQLPVSALGLAANEYVTIVKWIFRNPQRGFTHNGNRFRVRGPLLEIDRNGNPVMTGDLIENCSQVIGYLDGIAYPSSDCDQATADDPLVESAPSKVIIDGGSSLTSAGPYNPGDTLTYEIIARNNSASTDTLVNPILLDLLPSDLIYVSGSQSITANSAGHPVPVFEELQNYNSTGRTLLRWSWTGASAANFLPDEQVEFQFKVIIGSGVVAEQVIQNYAQQTTNDVPVQSCLEASSFDTFDLDDDGSNTDVLCESATIVEFDIQSVPSLASEKLVKGQLDTLFSKFPDRGKTVPGGSIEYQIAITNNGTMPMTNIVVIDILPFVGDTAVIDTLPRLSRWRPTLISPLSVPSGVTVYYSTEENPCRTAEMISPDDPTGCTAPNWSIIPPSDIATVQSFKVDFNNTIINPGDILTFEWDMIAPIDVLDGLGVLADTIAWNSFGYIAERINPDGSIGAPLLASEPFKVGIEVAPSINPSYGNFVWEDTNMDGSQDMGESGIDGVRVELYLDNGDGMADPAVDSLVSFTLTTGGGQYLFPELDTGDYFAVFYKPILFAITSPNAVHDTLDSDGIASTFNGFDIGITEVTTLSGGEQDLTWDFGVFPDNTAAVGNYVWYDSNEDGIQNEPVANGVNGIPVKIYTNTGTLIDSLVTQNDLNGNPGWYLFDSLMAGDYYIEFTIPTTFDFTTATHASGAIDLLDSDAVMTLDTTIAITDTLNLMAGELDESWDAGLILPTGQMSLGNFVWEDVNNDGDYDPATESGINGVIINLYEDTDGNGEFTPGIDAYLAQTTTITSGGNPGHYLFENLAEGDYIVQIDNTNFNSSQLLENYSSSTGNGIAPDPDDNQNFDDNGEPLDGYGIVSQAVTLSFGNEPDNDEDTDTNSNLTVDFGLFPGNPCSILIDNLTFGECNESSGTPQIELNYTINWFNAPDPSENISVNVGGVAQSPISTTAEGNGSQNFTTLIDADGSTNDLIAHFQTSTDCADTLSYTVNNGCFLRLIKSPDTVTTYVGDTVLYNYMVINNSSEIITLDSIVDDKIGTISTTMLGTARVSDDLQVYYRFEDMSGTTIADVSGVSPALDLTIENVNYSWGSDSLIFNGANRASNTTDNNKVYTSAINGDEFTVEAWITPASTSNTGPARIVTLSQDGSNRNFSLNQDATSYEFRHRTSMTNSNGTTYELNGGTVNTTSPTHLVAVRRASNTVEMFVNNVSVANDVSPGIFTVVPPEWQSDYDFGIGNEFGGGALTDKDWQGSFHLVAFYGKALSNAEITQNYNAALMPATNPTSLNPGDTATFSATYVVSNSDLPGPIINEAIVSGRTVSGVQVISSDTAAVSIPSANIIDLSLSKTVDNSVANVGDTVTFTLIVLNDGPDPATNIQVTDTIPSGFNYINNNGGDYVSNIWMVNDLGVGESDTLLITAEVLASGDYNNLAQIFSHTEPDSDSSPNNDDGDQSEDDEDNAEVTPSLEFDLALDKHLSVGQSDTISIGDDISYTIVITNEGDVTANMVQICENIPRGLQLSSNDTTGWTGTSNDTLYHTINDPILPGTSDSVTIILRVRGGVSGGSILNLAQITDDRDNNDNGVEDRDSDPDNRDGEDDESEETVTLQEHDPSGYIYCDKTGKVVTGGTISVTGPNGIVNDEVDIIEDGSNGYYEWYATGLVGSYTIAYSHPNGHTFSTIKLPVADSLDPTGLADPLLLGSDTSGMYLLDTTFANNPYYLKFHLDIGDPVIQLNNIPVNCVFIGSIICEDDDQNDMDDGNEPALANVLLRLYDCADTTVVLDSTFTDINGYYRFDGLSGGDYRVQVVDPSGFRIISSQADTVSADGFMSCVTLNLGECDTTKSVCFRRIPYDWGDLPDGTIITQSGDYQTTNANNGPSHQIISGLLLGSTIDAENNGQQSTAADGDGADEDGFTFPNTLNINRNITIRRPLNITNTTGITAHLEAWIDWNGDGDFDDLNEMIVDISDDGAGDFGVSSLTINVPSNAVLNQAIGVRFRLSQTDNMTPYGQVDSGEVEDYLISIGCPLKQCLPAVIEIDLGNLEE